MDMNAAMGYDRAITVFSPDGRLYQVEYAREAVKKGSTVIGIKCPEMVMLMADKRVSTKLIDPDSIEKIYVIDDHIGAAASGILADARMLVDRARVEAQINVLRFDEPMSVEAITKRICDVKQSMTQFGGSRPLGISMIIAGGDTEGLHLYETDPSGSFIGVKATAIGEGRTEVFSILDEKYTDDLDSNDMAALALDTMRSVKKDEDLSVQQLTVATVKRDDNVFHVLESKEKDALFR